VRSHFRHWRQLKAYIEVGGRAIPADEVRLERTKIAILKKVPAELVSQYVVANYLVIAKDEEAKRNLGLLAIALKRRGIAVVTKIVFHSVQHLIAFLVNRDGTLSASELLPSEFWKRPEGVINVAELDGSKVSEVDALLSQIPEAEKEDLTVTTLATQAKKKAEEAKEEVKAKLLAVVAKKKEKGD